MRIDFETRPERYRHWKLAINGPVADLILDVDETAGLFEGYELKLNSYDLGVDIELHDAVQRLRFEHPGVRTVVVRSARDRVFCAGANIRMLAGASHGHKVNFCKFTNETRNAMEDASANSGQRYIAALNGACAGGGYELALACDHIILIDDGASAVSLPEVSVLAVLPGTGGVTPASPTSARSGATVRISSVPPKRESAAGGRGSGVWSTRRCPPRVSRGRWRKRAAAFAAVSDRPADADGITLGPLARSLAPDRISYSHLDVAIDRTAKRATITVSGPPAPPPDGVDALPPTSDGFWPLELARELDDALLNLRFNEAGVAIIVFRSAGDPARVLAASTGSFRTIRHTG